MSTMIGRFELLVPLARGGMGVVWRAVHETERLEVAIKVIAPERAPDPEQRAAFLREIRAQAMLRHPAVVHVFACGEVAGSPYVAMELASEGALDAHAGKMPWPRLRQVLLSTLSGLAHAHAHGVLHLDVKPANVLLGGLRPGAKLGDFGIAHLADQLAPDKVAGTSSYMAPERFTGSRTSWGPWTDLYAVGCLAFTMVCGRPLHADVESPFLGVRTPFRPQMPVPAGLEEWVMRLAAPDPEQRPRCAADAAVLLRALPGAEQESPPPEVIWPSEPAPPPLPQELAVRLSGVGTALLGLRPPAFVGRTQERQVLWRSLRRVVESGRSEALALLGPAGVGASRLAQWLAAGSQELGCARAVHVRPRPGASVTLEEQLVLALTGERGLPLAPGLRLGGADLILAQQGGHRARSAALARLLGRVAAEVPLVLWIDDVQRAPSALELVRALLEQQAYAPCPVMVVLTGRDGAAELPSSTARVLAELVKRRDVRRLDITPLPPDAHATLVRGLLPLHQALAVEVAELSNGNPSLAVHLVQAWVRDGALQSGPHGFELRPGTPPPLTGQAAAWQEVVSAALKGWPEAAVRSLQLAAVLGETWELPTWSSACGHAGIEPSETLIEAWSSIGLLRRGPSSYGFCHPLARSALLDSIPSSDLLRSWHAACAAALPSDQAAAAEHRGRHLLEAGEPEDALELLLAAVSARRFARCDFGVAERLALLCDAAIADLRLDDEDPRRAQVALEWAGLLRQQGRYADAADASQRAARLAAATGRKDLINRAHYERAHICIRQGALQPALRHFDQIKNAAAGGAVDHARAQVLVRLGRLDDAHAALCRARDAGGDAYSAVMLELKFAMVEWRRGLFEVALQHLDRAAALNEELGTHDTLGVCALIRGNIFMARGHVDEAESAYQESLVLLRATGSEDEALAAFSLGCVALKRQQWPQARQLLDVALATFESRGHRCHLASAHIAAVALYAGNGAWEECREHLEEAAALIEETGERKALVVSFLEQAELLARPAGQLVLADACLDLAGRITLP